MVFKNLIDSNSLAGGESSDMDLMLFLKNLEISKFAAPSLALD